MLKFLLGSYVNTYKASTVAQPIIAAERTVIGYVLNWVRIIGTGLALIMLTYMAIVYMNAAPTRKEDIKGRIGNFAIGAIVFIGASNILYYAQEIVVDIFGAL